MRSRVAIRGNFFASCIPEGAPDGKSAPPWQHIAVMYPKQAGFGKICAPCIRKAPQTAFRECIARRSCQGGALFAALTPQIMHGAQILPRFSARKVLRVEGWRRWVVASALCIEADGPHVRTRPSPTAPHPVTKPRTGGPCTPVAATAFGERTVRRRVCLPEQRPSCGSRSSLRGRRFLATACPELPASRRVSPRSRCCGERTVRARLSRGAVCLRHPLATTACPGVARPARSSPRCRHFSVSASSPTESCAQWQLHAPWASCSSAAARTPLVGSGFPRRSAQKKRPAERWSLWQFADYAQAIQRVPSGDDQARRPADGA